jgi:hypothetical protein
MISRSGNLAARLCAAMRQRALSTTSKTTSPTGILISGHQMPSAHDRDEPSIVPTKIMRKINEIRALPDPNQYRFIGKKFTSL